MKFKGFLLAIATLTLGSSFAAPAEAQQQYDEARSDGSLRWSYAPTQIKYRRPVNGGNQNYSGPVSSVARGSTPKNPYLGVDPSFLKKPAPPPMSVVTSSLTPRIVPQQTTAFNPLFGKPIQEQTAKPTAMTAPQVPAAKSTSQPRRSSGVSGRLRPYRQPNAQVATAGNLKPIGYGNQGFSKGTYIPSAGSSGAGSVSTAVSGSIVSRH